MTACPSRAQLARLLAERLPEEEEDELASHLEACPVCQQVLEELTAAPVLVDPQATTFTVGASKATGLETPAPSDATNPLDVDFRRHLQEQLASEVTPHHHAASAGERQPAPGTHETELPVIPGYEILKELGRGGMGVVYKARHVKLNRLVALKMILADEFAPAPHLSRFLVEGEMIARLQHPNIVQIYQVGQHRGRPFFELEYVAGGTLAGLLKKGSLATAAAVRLVQQLANAVQYAHSQGIVHRDLKPANILMQKDEGRRMKDEGREAPISDSSFNLPPSSFLPKITDFGLAKQAQLRSDLTTTGVVMGTPSYMAPEQAEASRNVGPAADIHALGAILYELLTGQPPFKAESPMATAFQVLNEEPTPPGRLRPQTAVDLETICLKCLQKDPQQRYRSAAELEDDLGRFERGEPIRARAVGWWERSHKWARRRPALASLLATLAVLAVTSFAVITWLWNQAEIKAIAETNANSKAQQHAQREQQARQDLERQTVGIVLDQGQRLAAAGDVDQGLLVMARALELAADAKNADLERVVRINLASWQQHLVMQRGQFKHRGRVWSAAFSPDSQTVVTVGEEDRVARRWSVASGKKIEPPLPHAYPVWSAAFSPDGRFLLTGAGGPDGGEAKLWNAATGAPIHNFSLVHETRVHAVAFHPDGNAFLTLALDGARLWNTATCKPIGPVLQHPGLRAGCFSPTGRWVVTGGSDGVARLWETSSGRAPLLRHGLPTKAPVEAVAFSPNEGIVATGGADGAVRLWDTDTGESLEVAMLHRGPVRCVAFSPDGKLIASGAAAKEKDATKGWQITDGETRLWDAATGKLRYPPITCAKPVWSVAFNPDGRLLLTGSQDRCARLYWTASGRQLGRTLVQEGTVSNVYFSPDGCYALAASAGGDLSAAARLLDVSQASATARPWPQRANRMAVSSDGGTMLIANKQRARLWDSAAVEPIGQEVNHGSEIAALAFHPRNEAFATIDSNGGVRVWDRATQRPLGACSHSGAIWLATFTTHGAGLLTVRDDTIYEWKLSSEKAELARPPRKPGGRVALLDHERQIAWVVLPDGQLVRWDLESFEATKSWRIPDPERGLKCSPDGRTVLSGVGAFQVQLWDTATGKPKGPPLTHDGDKILLAEFSADSRFVATASERSIQLWDVETVRALGGPMPQNDRPFRVAFLADGQTLVAHGLFRGELLLWPIPQPLPGSPAEIRAQVARLTGLTLDSEGVIRPGAD